MSIGIRQLDRLFFFRNLDSSRQKWEFRALRFEPLEERLVLNVAPIIQGLPEVLNLAPGTSYHVALDGKDSDSANLTYTIQNTNDELLKASVLDGNKSVKFTVYQKNTSGNWESLGNIIFELFEDEAPLTTKRFQEIVNGTEGVGGSIVSYDGAAIHRILDGFMFQGGDVQNGNGTGGTGVKINDEYNDLLQHSGRGIVSTANSNNPEKNIYNTNDSQFFITDNATPWLNKRHNVFGFVTEGDDVRKKVNALPASEQYGVPTRNVKMDDFEIFSDTENGTLRIVVPKDAQAGTSTITVMVSDGVNEPVPYEIKVNILAQAPTTKPAWSVPRFIEMEAGGKHTFTLPEYLSPGQIDYYFEKVANYTSSDLKVTRNGRDITIEAPKAGGGLQWIIVGADAKDGDVAAGTYTFGSPREYVALFITPSAPKLALSSQSDSGTAGDSVTSANNSTGKELFFEVTDVLSQYTTLTLYRNGIEVPSEPVSSMLQENGLHKVTLKLKTTDVLSDGSYSWTVKQTYAPPTDTITHAPMSSEESATLAVVIDTKKPVFVSPEGNALFDAKVGQEFSVDFRTDDHISGKVHYKILTVKKDGEVIAIPSGMKIHETGGKLTWTPAEGDSAEYTIEIQATDGAGNTSSKSVEVIFQDGPEFSISGPQTLNEGERFILVLTPFAEEGAEIDPGITIALKPGSLPEGADYTIEKQENGSFVFTWNTTEAEGPAEYQAVFIATGSDKKTRRKDAILKVNEIDSAPEFTNEFPTVYEANEHEKWTLKLTAEDADVYPGESNPLTYSIYGSAPEGMVIDATTGEISWTPGEDCGGARFQIVVRVADKKGLFSQKTIDIFVKEHDQAPVFEEGETHFKKNTGEHFQATAAATDPDYASDPEVPLNRIRYSLEGENIPEGMSVNPDTGVISWNIPRDFLESVMYGTVSFTIKAQEITESGAEGLATTREIEIDLTNQMMLDAIAEEAAREASLRNARTAAFQQQTGFSAVDMIWMLNFGGGRQEFGYVPTIDLGHSQYTGLGSSFNSRYEIGIEGFHGNGEPLDGEQGKKKEVESEAEKTETSESETRPRTERGRAKSKGKIPAVAHAIVPSERDVFFETEYFALDPSAEEFIEETTPEEMDAAIAMLFEK